MMFQVNPLHMKNQALFSSEDKSIKKKSSAAIHDFCLAL